MTKHIIENDEETKCSECFYPLYKGDEAFTKKAENKGEDKAESKVYCSKSCYRIGERLDATFGKITPKGVQAGCFDV